MTGPARRSESRSAHEERGLSHWEGEPLGVWASLWGVPHFEAYLTMGSTNDRVRELASRGAPAFTVVTAEEQTAGRGRNGRRWASAASKGLWISILLRLRTEEARATIPIVVGLAVCRAVEHVVPGLAPRIKWPNDVMIGDRKLCGVLCEAGSAEAVVAGVGLNVGQRPRDFPEGVRASAVSLSMATGQAVPRSKLAGALVRELRGLLSRRGAPLDGEVGWEIERRDALRGRRIQISEGPVGVAEGIDERGRLRIRVPSGEVEQVVAGSVSLLDG